jgi:ribosomal protein L11 methyltransferase
VIRLAVRVHREQAELVLAELLELAPAGVEESALDGELIEYAVYGAAGELPSLPDLEAAAGDALVEISTSETADDWPERWKSFHKPILVEPPPASAAGIRSVPALHVRPPWELDRHQGGGASEEIVIDPGRAFGTGAHATTRMCLELLLELASEQRTLAGLLDIGTGSGVLAIAAARLGFEPVLAIDNERESVEAARVNAVANDVVIEARRLDLREQPLPWLSGHDATRAPIVVLANLLRPLLLELAQRITVAPTQMIASGLLVEQVDEVAGAFAEQLGMRERRRSRSGEWAAVWLAAPG